MCLYSSKSFLSIVVVQSMILIFLESLTIFHCSFQMNFQIGFLLGYVL